MRGVDAAGPELGVVRESQLPKGPYTAHLRILVPKTIPGIVFENRVPRLRVYGPFGNGTIATEADNGAPHTAFCDLGQGSFFES